MMLLIKVKCPEETCVEDYIGETGWKFSEDLIDYNGCDKNSPVLKHCPHKISNLKNYTFITQKLQKLQN